MQLTLSILEGLVSNRAKSFYWRTGMMALAFIVGEVSANLGVFELPLWLTTILGLILGEVSKALNNLTR